jgi:hypothetical protein
MKQYINKEKKNIHEEGVRNWYEKNGYTSLAKGWPDFVFFKYLGNQKDSPMDDSTSRSSLKGSCTRTVLDSVSALQ